MAHTVATVDQPAACPPGLRIARETVPLRRRLLLAEDDDGLRRSLRRQLETDQGARVDAVANGVEALKALACRYYSLLVTGLRTTGLGALRLLEEVRARRVPVTVIVTTAHGGIEAAVQAIRLGAFDFLVHPIEREHLRRVVGRALHERSLQDEVALLAEHLQSHFLFHDILSKSPAMHAVFQLVNRVAPTEATVLIEGETGTGKELVARALHRASPRGAGPLVAVNCASLPETLLESELFGHEKGAFTGAVGRRRGRFELADGGTTFLDDVGDIPPAMQAKLLRFLQERRFERVGGTETIAVDERVIAASNRPLAQLVREGRFRQDLFYRLSVVKIDLPPLRERREDIPLLATHFAARHSPPGEGPKRLSPPAMELLLSYPWPGNVRELENAVERACVTSHGPVIRPEALPSEVGLHAPLKLPVAIDLGRPLPELQRQVTSDIERQYIRQALEKSRGNISRCAKICGLSRRTLFDKILTYKIDKAAFRDK
jgi:DNA-binding NtrC family response regulator